ncbi:MAG: flavin reductase family protein [Conexivisphaerales archaeon]
MKKPADIAEDFRNVMRNYPQGVAVLASSADGNLYGMTVSSFISVSMSPPLLLVSIMKGNHIHDVFAKCDHFSLTILAYDQSELSERFSKFQELERRFDGVDYTLEERGLPILDDSVAGIICERWKNVEAGDHTLLIGRVVYAKILNEKLPLVYFRREYTTVKQKELADRK